MLLSSRTAQLEINPILMKREFDLILDDGCTRNFLVIISLYHRISFGTQRSFYFSYYINIFVLLSEYLSYNQRFWSKLMVQY